MNRPKQIAVLVSGNGSNLQALIDAVERGELDAEIKLVVSNRANVYALQRAAKHGIPTWTTSLREFCANGATRQDYDRALADGICERVQPVPDLVVLAGWMHILAAPFLERFPPRSLVNLHPALPGQFDGARAIERAFAAYSAGEITHTGVMVHHVVAEVDRGAVIVQEAVPFEHGDTLESVSERIHSVEHRLLVAGVRRVLFG